MLCSISSFAIKTTISSSIQVSQSNGGSVSIMNTIPSCSRRVHIFNHCDSLPEISTALIAAEYIFSDVLLKEHIDLVDINASVDFGTNYDMEAYEVCKVFIDYTDTIRDNSCYHNFSTLYSSLPVLYPKTMTNQTLGIPSGVSMHILLNPSLPYHCDTTEVPSDKYDLITILLRALSMGCGIQSSLDPNTMQFGKTENGVTYITVFDTQIYNDNDDTYADVVIGDVSAVDFLSEHSVFADGLTDADFPQPIQLFNDWILGTLNNTIVTDKTLNTIDYNTYTSDELDAGFYDLLDSDMIPGIAIRTITPYTLALLRKLGWMKTVPVGEYNPLVALYNTHLTCNGKVLQPDSVYIINMSPNNIDFTNVTCKINSVDSSYTIGNILSNNLFYYNTIPQNIQWQRNPITKNIVGHIEADAIMHVSGQTISLPRTYEIEIPYKPNRPLVQRSEETVGIGLNLHLHAFSNGCNSYTVTYTCVNYPVTKTFTVYSNVLDTILTDSPAGLLYNLSVYGTNSQGNSDTYTFTFGFSAHPVLNMTVYSFGNILRYDLSNNGTIDISDVVINSVQITDAGGYVWLSPNAGSGEDINISSLPRGQYILTVIADGNTYSRIFNKR